MGDTPRTDPPKLSLLVPCYNEEKRVGATAKTVIEFIAESELDAELILIDDGSQDGTWALLEGLRQAHPVVRTVHLEKNRGKGGALAAGVDAARGEYVLFFDADLSHGTENIRRALDVLERGADLVIGARDLNDDGDDYPLTRRVTSAVFNLVIDSLLGLGIPDTQCGFKAFRREVAGALFRTLTVSRFSFDVELLFLAKRWGHRIERIPIEVEHQEGSTVRVFRDGIQMFGDVVRIAWNAKRGRYPKSANR